MVALSALINALYETNMAVVVRKVYSAATAPKLGCLLPHIKSSYEVRGELKKHVDFNQKIGFFIFLNYLVYKFKTVGF